jgi:hypothetical protein
LLYKAEGAATATPPAPYVETATDRKARRFSKACDLMHEEIERMRGDGTPQAVIQAHEQAYGRMHMELVALHDPEAARRLTGEADNDASTERNDMSTELVKRAAGSDGAGGLLTVAEIEAKQEIIAPLLGELYDDIRRMRMSPETPPSVIERHEQAYRDLGTEYKALDAQRGRHEAAVQRIEAEGPLAALAKCEQLRKSGRRLSPADEFREAMRDPSVVAAYHRESGTAPPAPPSRDGLAKAAGDSYAEHSGTVDRLASVLEKSEGLSPSRAYARALSESGVYAVA